MSEETFRVKQLDQKKEKYSIFIGSSTESLPVAKAIQQYLIQDGRDYEVDVWDEDIFDPTIQQGTSEYGIGGEIYDKGKKSASEPKISNSKEGHGPTNLESLRNFSDIYDFAIFVFVPDDKLVSQTRKHLETKTPLEGYGTRHNLVFEFGLFLGRIGPKKTFVIADDSVAHFIDNFFTDLKGVTLYKYKSQYAEWLAAGRPEEPKPYDQESLSQQVDLIKAAIRATEPDIEIGFLPSTSLAIGFYENMMKLVVENLIKMRKGIPVTPDQKPAPLDMGPPVRLEFPLQRGEVRFKLVIPDKLVHASHQAYQACVNHYGLIRVAIPTPTRAITVFCHPEVLKPNGRLVIYDIPSTLFSSWNAIDLLTNVQDIRQLLDEKEKRNFKKTINHLINKYQDKEELAGIKQMVEVITIGDMAVDFPGVEAFVMG